MSSACVTSLKQRTERRSSRSARRDLPALEVAGRDLHLLRRELQPELGRLVRGLEEQLVVVGTLLRASSAARAARRCAGSARSRSRPARAGPARTRPRGRSARCLDMAAAYFRAVSDLFADAAARRLPDSAPLAMRLRPATLDEFVGQQHVLGRGSALRTAIAEDRVRSAIFFGPPGSGQDDACADRRRDDRRRVRGALGGLGERRRRPRGPGPRARAPRAPRAGGRSCSSTRSTGSTRRSRTPCCPRSRRGSSR